MTRTCPGYADQPAHDVDEADFYADQKRHGGFSRLCRECHKARGRDYHKTTYYPEHAEQQKAAVVERRRERKREQREAAGKSD